MQKMKNAEKQREKNAEKMKNAEKQREKKKWEKCK